MLVPGKIIDQVTNLGILSLCPHVLLLRTTHCFTVHRLNVKRGPREVSHVGSRKFPPKFSWRFRLVRKGNGTPAISGKSRLGKYYSIWPDIRIEVSKKFSH